MYNTLKLLRPFVKAEYSQLALESLAEMYKIQPETSILATVYSRIINLAIVIKNNYYGLDEEDVSSYCLERLDFCLKSYDVDKNVKFTTYFCKVFGNKLREVTQKLNCKKRKTILESINEILEIGVEDTYNLIECLLPDTLTTKEYEYCKLASEGYDNTTIAEMLDVSRTTVCNIRKSLKIKLNGLQFD